MWNFSRFSNIQSYNIIWLICYLWTLHTVTVLLEYFDHNGVTFIKVYMLHFLLRWYCVNYKSCSNLYGHNGCEHIAVSDHMSTNSLTTLLVRSMILLFIKFCEAYQLVETLICNGIPLLSGNLKWNLNCQLWCRALMPSRDFTTYKKIPCSSFNYSE